MKVLAVNGSPKGAGGNTALILDPFLKGMQEAGAEVEIVLLKEMRILPCMGDYSCWHRTPGRCVIEDDMASLLPSLASCDILVLATPVYVDGVTGPMKGFMDRIIPVVSPRFEMREGHCRHPRLDGSAGGSIVLVSNCGFWEMDNFDPLVTHVGAAARNMDREYAGALLRPHGPALAPMLRMGLPVDDVLEAAAEAGRQIVSEGRMRAETLAAVSRPLLALEEYVRLVNQSLRDG
jgi:multimeric flavodoxin WrbA